MTTSQNQDPTFNTTLPEDKGKYGALQRLRFVIPKPATTLLLGERFKDDPPFGYSGASLKTDVNLFVDIKEKTLFQGRGPVVLQSPATWTQYVTGVTTLYGAANVNVTAGKALLLASVPPGQEQTGADLKEDHGAQVPEVKSYVALREGLIKEQSRRVKTWGTPASTMEGTETDLGTTSSGQIVDASKQTASAVLESALQEDGSGPTHAGVALIAKDSIGGYASGHVVLSGQMGMTLLAGDGEQQSDLWAFASKRMELRAGDHAKVYGEKRATVEAGTSADLSAGTSVLVGARTGTAVVQAPTVHVGSLNPGPRAGSFDVNTKQQETKKVLVESKDLTSINSLKDVTVEAVAKIEMTVGSFKVTVKPDGVTIEGGASKAEVKTSSIKLTVGGSEVLLGPAAVTVKSGASKVDTAAAGVTIAGPMIKLG